MKLHSFNYKVFMSSVILIVCMNSYIFSYNVKGASLKSELKKKSNVVIKNKSKAKQKKKEVKISNDTYHRLSRGTSTKTVFQDNGLPQGDVEDLMDYAYNFIGKPYAWAGVGPNSFDCSGFTQYVYKKFGVSLEHFTGEQVKEGIPVEREELKKGDLIFFNTYEKSSHVGIYAGDGKFIHASSGGKKVLVSDLSNYYYNKRFAGARRIFK